MDPKKGDRESEPKPGSSKDVVEIWTVTLTEIPKGLPESSCSLTDSLRWPPPLLQTTNSKSPPIRIFGWLVRGSEISQRNCPGCTFGQPQKIHNAKLHRSWDIWEWRPDILHRLLLTLVATQRSPPRLWRSWQNRCVNWGATSWRVRKR